MIELVSLNVGINLGTYIKFEKREVVGLGKMITCIPPFSKFLFHFICDWILIQLYLYREISFTW